MPDFENISTLANLQDYEAIQCIGDTIQKKHMILSSGTNRSTEVHFEVAIRLLPVFSCT